MSEHEHPPIKRHAALVPLSRDHQLGLQQARLLREAADKTSADRVGAVKGFLAAWDKEIHLHFDDEEHLFGPHLTPDEKARLESEHEDLRSRARDAVSKAKSADPGADWTRTLGDKLNDHIRWEERQLFNALQDRMTMAQLAELAQETAEVEASRDRG
jgi:hemerythrin-like domain-containing protein